MAIIEIIGGPITHKYLMGKTKHDLADMYMRLLRETASEAKDAARYRWLRQYNIDSYLANGKLEVLDAAIDAALAGVSEGKE